MNPFALLLLAAVAGGGRIPGFSHEASPVRLDRILDQLHGAVNTLEKVNEISRMGTSLSNLSGLAPRQVPSSAHIPAPSLPEGEASGSVSPEAPPSSVSPELPAFDLQSAMQTLGPLLSMLGNNQNSK